MGYGKPDGKTVLTFGSVFSGIGLLDYGLHLAGIQHAWFCEADPWRREILRKRWPGVPVYDDVRTVGADTAVRVDGIAGGFPCKGASTAGPRTGFDHPETVLWREMRRLVGELRPHYVVVENVANLLAVHDGAVWGEVVGDLAALGYDTAWDCLPAAAVGAPHRRDRVFAVATHAASEHQRATVDAADSESRARRARGISRVGGSGAAPDAERECGSGRRASRDVPQAAGRAEGEARQRQRRRDAADDRGATTPDADSPRADTDASPGGSRSTVGERGISVDWAEYEPAIRRWEAIAGTAPEPLLRRVDDRGTSRLELARLSALGDGVQVQLGQLVGAYILERERLAA